MKKYIIILLFLFIGTANAQDPALAENIWYFDNGVLDGEAFTLPGYLMAQLEFLPDYSNLGVKHPHCEESMAGTIDSIDMAGFSLVEASVILIGTCDPGEVELMEPHYRIYADYPNTITPFNPFTYNIETVDDYQQLTITNGNGDVAVYNSVPPLAVPAFSENIFAIYPNPTQDVLHITSKTTTVSHVSIYDIQGKLIQTIVGNPKEIDVSLLKNGLYLVKLQADGGTVFKKVVKE